MADMLYRVSGLNVKNNPIYSFSPKQEKNDDSFVKSAFKQVFEKMNHMPNAAASNHGKPVIMISEALLEILDDDEEYAVLAHEFTHAAAHHQKMSSPQKVLSGITRASNTFLLLGQWLGAGFLGVATSILSGMSANTMMKTFNPNRAILETKDAKLGRHELALKKAENKRIGSISGYASLAVASVFNSALLPYFIACKSISTTSKFINASMSRRNEFHADRGAVQLGTNPLALVTSLRKLEQV